MKRLTGTAAIGLLCTALAVVLLQDRTDPIAHAPPEGEVTGKPGETKKPIDNHVTSTRDETDPGNDDGPDAHPAASYDARIIIPTQSASESDYEWAVSTFINNPESLDYDHVYLVDIDWPNLVRPIKASYQYLAAVSSAAPSGGSTVDFEFHPADGKAYRLLIKSVAVRQVEAQTVIIAKGTVMADGDAQGLWLLNFYEASRDLGGYVSAADYVFAIGPGPPTSSFYVVKEMTQAKARAINQRYGHGNVLQREQAR
jgi:hypothetical protein